MLQNSSLGRKLDLLMVALVIISVVVMILETMPELSRLRRAFLTIEVIFVVIFIAEYAVRVFVSRPRRAYIFSFYGLVDLLAILPMLLLPTASGVRVVRLLRVFRLMRLFKLSRYTGAIRLFQVALWDIKEELVLFMVFTMMVILALAFGIYHFENPVQPEFFRSVPASLWWAIVSLTSVGYGDAYPITTGRQNLHQLHALAGHGRRLGALRPAGRFPQQGSTGDARARRSACRHYAAARSACRHFAAARGTHTMKQPRISTQQTKGTQP